jgi:hypothetical protein
MPTLVVGMKIAGILQHAHDKREHVIEAIEYCFFSPRKKTGASDVPFIHNGKPGSKGKVTA